MAIEWKPILVSLNPKIALCLRLVCSEFLTHIHTAVLPQHGPVRDEAVQWVVEHLTDGTIPLDFLKWMAQVFQITGVDIQDRQRSGWDWAYRRFVSRKTRVDCFGDSHLTMFTPIQQTPDILPLTEWHIHHVAGATAMGLVNPNSKTQALPRFRDILATTPKQGYLLFLLGEVDCGFVIWYRAAKYQLSVDTQLQQSLHNYTSFVMELREQGYCNIIICSATLPTILDGCDWGDVATARRDVTVSLKDRTALTVIYNRHLENFCRKNNFFYLDMQKYTLNSTTGIVRNKFRNPNPKDHHLSSTAILPFLVKELMKIGFR